MAGFGNTFRKAVTDYLFGKAAFTNPNGIYYISLHSGDPGPDGQTANEITGVNLARKVTAASDLGSATTANPSVITNTADIVFGTASGAVGTATYAGIWRTVSGTTAADFVGASQLPGSMAVGVGNQPKILAGSFTHSFQAV
jgi:hypothetical protein